MLNNINIPLACAIIQILIFKTIKHQVCFGPAAKIMKSSLYITVVQLFSVLLLPLFITCSSSNVDPLTESLVQFNQTVELDISVCMFHLVMGSKKATYSYQCQSKQTYGVFTVQELIKDQKHDEHSFRLTSSTPQAEGTVTCMTKYGMQWKFNITVMTNQSQNVTIEGSTTLHEYEIVWVILAYSIAAAAILPFRHDYYLYMSSLPIYSCLISLLLSTAAIINIGVIVYKYMRQSILLGQTPLLLIFILVLCLVVGLVHLHLKNRVYLQKFHSLKLKLTMMVLSYAILLLGLVLYINMHKDVSTYVVFASGLTYYMVGFIIFKEMKTRQVYFSFRLIAFDTSVILLLVACSKLYPILHYQIPNFYMLVGALLIASTVLIYGGITYILVNVIKYDSQQQNKSEVSLNNGKEPSRHQFDFKEQRNKIENRGIELVEEDEGRDPRWMKLTHSSISNQASLNSQIDQEMKLSMRIQV